jgi:hypothetical protein
MIQNKQFSGRWLKFTTISINILPPDFGDMYQIFSLSFWTLFESMIGNGSIGLVLTAYREHVIAIPVYRFKLFHSWWKQLFFLVRQDN